jgi:AraC-like DNA-binding protein
MQFKCGDMSTERANRLMWITPDRVFYCGLLGVPSVRTMGTYTVYVAVTGTLRIRLGDGPWQITEMAVVPPYEPHQVSAEARMVNVIHVEAETVDAEALPAELKGRGAIDAPAFVRMVQQRQRELSEGGRAVDLMSLNFDQTFFGAELAARRIDSRIANVLTRIKDDPSAPGIAEAYAEVAHLSFSRFLHLFKQEVGAPFRSFRTWKRARNLLHYVNRTSNLAYVALDTGYPDSTHFSHSIRKVFGLKPSDIFAGSRKLAVYSHAPSTLSSQGAR